MNPTIQIAKLIGSPFASARPLRLSQDEFSNLYQHACKNRMPFLLLEANSVLSNETRALYQKEDARRLKTEEAVAKSSRVLADASLEHAIFKTIRPYRSTTVDIDIIIFKDYANAIDVMHRAGYKLVVRGPRSTTFWDECAEVGIDLYEQVAVSYISYIDNRSLINHSVTTRLSNGERISILRPEADLACIIAHSMIKEQMYTLSEYYSYIYYLRQMNINDFLRIVRQNNMVIATRTHTAITALLHDVAHKTIPDELQQILKSLGKEYFETTRVLRRDFETPHKYHPITVAKSLLEIANGTETRRSMAEQLIHMLDPKISRDFLKKLLNHISRQTY